MGVNGKHTGGVFASRLIRTIRWSIILGLFLTVLSNPGGGARISAHVQTDMEAHPASSTMGTESLPRG